MTTFRNDPTLDELLGDPITRALMQADRVDPLELEIMLRALARRIARPAGRSNGNPLDAERVSFDRRDVGRFLRSMVRARSKMPRRLAVRPGMRPHTCGASVPW